MAENKFNSTVEALFNGMDSVISSKTVVGDAIHVGETIILPLVDVSFAVGAGTFLVLSGSQSPTSLKSPISLCFSLNVLSFALVFL